MVNRNDFLKLLDLEALQNPAAQTSDDGCCEPTLIYLVVGDKEEWVNIAVYFKFMDSHFEISCVSVSMDGYGWVELWGNGKSVSSDTLENDEEECLLTYANWVKEYVHATHSPDRCFVYSNDRYDEYFPVK